MSCIQLNPTQAKAMSLILDAAKPEETVWIFPYDFHIDVEFEATVFQSNVLTTTRRVRIDERGLIKELPLD